MTGATCTAAEQLAAVKAAFDQAIAAALTDTASGTTALPNDEWERLVFAVQPLFTAFWPRTETETTHP